MKLNRISISNILNIGNIDISLEDLSALIAPNNYGKSNVLRSIKYGVDFMQASYKKKQMLMRTISFVPINNTLEGLPFCFEIEGEFEEGENQWNFVYGYSFEWAKTKRGDTGAKIIEEHLRMKSADDMKFKSYINRSDSMMALYLAAPTGRCAKQLPVEENILALNKLSNFDDLFYIGAIRALNNIDVKEINTLDNPDEIFNVIPSDEVMGVQGLDYPKQSNVAQYLYKLKEQNFAKYELLKDVITNLLPTIEDFEPVQINLKRGTEGDGDKDLPFRLPEILYDVRVKEKYNNQSTSINRISAGSKKIFFLLTLVVAAEINKVPLILVEELENSVHPRLLQNLLTAINELAGDTKVMITSHSPYLIKYLDPRKMKFGMPSEEGVADFRALKQSKISKILKNASAEEVSVGEYLFELLLDVEEDNEVLDEYFK